jgi:hypothetical protein
MLARPLLSFRQILVSWIILLLDFFINTVVFSSFQGINLTLEMFLSKVLGSQQLRFLLCHFFRDFIDGEQRLLYFQGSPTAYDGNRGLFCTNSSCSFLRCAMADMKSGVAIGGVNGVRPLLSMTNKEAP